MFFFSGKPVMKKSATMAAAPPAMGAIQAIQWRSQRTFVETIWPGVARPLTRIVPATEDAKHLAALIIPPLM